MKKQFKIFKAIIKNLDEVNHTAEVTVSTASIDRDSEVILPSAFEKRLNTYLAHPIMLASHNPYELTNQIGEAKKVTITDKGLDVIFEWYAGKGNFQADWGWFLAAKGIAAFSVGMMVYGYEQGKYLGEEGYANGIRGTFTDVELLEISQVLIPSNRDALMSRLGKAKNEEAELLQMAAKSIKDEEWRQEPEYCDCPKDNTFRGAHIKGILTCLKCNKPIGKAIATKPEETDNFIRIPIHNSDDYKDIKTITLSEEQGITALIGKLKSGDDDSTHVITVIFDKDKGWDMEKAKKWVEDHKDDLKSFFEPMLKIIEDLENSLKTLKDEFTSLQNSLGKGPEALTFPTIDDVKNWAIEATKSIT